MKKHFLYLFLVIAILLNGCSPLKNQKLFTLGEFSKKSFNTTIPFEIIHGLIILKVKLHQEEYNFAFDTGAEVGVISSELSSKLKLKKKSSINVTDSNKKSHKNNLYVLDNIGIGNSNFLDYLCVTADLSDLNNLFDCELTLHGLIGNSIIKNAVWKINYTDKTIEFWDNNQEYIPSKDAVTIPLEGKNFGNKYIKIEFDNMEHLFTFDTGSGGFIQIDKSFENNFSHKKNAPNYAEGISLSVGLHGGVLLNKLEQKINSFNIGRLVIKNKIISFQENSKALIGNQFWKNYTVTIDWKKSLLHLNQNQELTPDSLYVFQYELAADPIKKKFYFSNFWKTHKLYQEINTNAEIVSIDKYKISALDDFCEFKNGELQKLIKKEKLDLVILENGKLKNISLQKEMLISEK